MTTTLIRGGAGAGEWQERLGVVEVPHYCRTISAKYGDASRIAIGQINDPFRSFKQLVQDLDGKVSTTRHATNAHIDLAIGIRPGRLSEWVHSQPMAGTEAGVSQPNPCARILKKR